MRHGRLRSVTLSSSVAALVVLALATTAFPERRTIPVDCDAGETIREGLRRVGPGDTLSIRGTCHESVLLPAELVGVTLDGGGKATIHHPGGAASSGAARHGVFVRGRGIAIRGLTISGAADGIHLSGPAHAVIEGNRITANDGRGIHIDKASVAQIADNTIVNNGGAGIQVTEASYARIGFLVPPDERLRPNTVRDNRADGVVVQRSSSAWIVGNTIAGNAGHGVVVDRGSDVDVVGNTIEANGGDAIRASRDSGINLTSQGTPRSEGPNRSDPAFRNGGVAIRCSVGGYVDGPIGTLSGAQGVKEIDGACVDRLLLP